jgi:hypothetical protein
VLLAFSSIHTDGLSDRDTVGGEIGAAVDLVLLLLAARGQSRLATSGVTDDDQLVLAPQNRTAANAQ